MMNAKNTSERRKYRRYRVKDGAFAAIASQHLMGPIRDISEGGVSFFYQSFAATPFHAASMDIFTDNTGFYLSALQFRPVSERVLAPPESSLSLTLRRLGGEFMRTTPDQLSRLKVFLQHNALNDP